mgnify:FL=1
MKKLGKRLNTSKQTLQAYACPCSCQCICSCAGNTSYSNSRSSLGFSSTNYVLGQVHS